MDNSEPQRPPAPYLPPTTTRTSPPYRTRDLLGQGGYGVVYRAFDTRSLIPISYAMKCLSHAHTSQSSHRRELHLHETCLHKLASTHPNGISLHREDGDLFTQILRQRRYLGQDELIECVFLQLLNAVEHSHSLGISQGLKARKRTKAEVWEVVRVAGDIVSVGLDGPETMVVGGWANELLSENMCYLIAQAVDSEDLLSFQLNKYSIISVPVILGQ